MFDYKKFQVYHRGEYIPFSDANISMGNISFLYGLAIFSGTRAHWNDKEKQLYIFRAKSHFQRLQNASKLMYMENFQKLDFEEYERILIELCHRNKIQQDTYIRTNVYYDETAIGPQLKYKDALNIYLFPLGNYVPLDGMKCCISSFTRISDNSIPARLKVNGAYVNTALAKTEALDNGFDEAIVLNSEGHAVEGSAENLFIVRDEELITPPVHDDILEGITRDTIITIAKDKGIKVTQRSIDRSELYFADEIFLSGTGAKVSPVIELDRRQIGNGKIGKISKKIQSTYFDIVEGKVPKYSHWLSRVY